MFCSECKPEHYVEDNRCIPCNAGETETTASVNFGLKVVVWIVLFASPFWLLMQLRGIFLGVGGVVAIVGGVGELPKSWFVDIVKMIMGFLKFLNVDVDATRPGCGGTPSTFVPVY